MAKCKWSVDGICQCFLIIGSNDHPACDGERKIACGQGRLDLVDFRDLKPKRNPGRGGRRAGAGAPKGNLNAIKSGVYSKQLSRLHQEEVRILASARAARARRVKLR